MLALPQLLGIVGREDLPAIWSRSGKAAREGIDPFLAQPLEPCARRSASVEPCDGSRPRGPPPSLTAPGRP